jgi:hypothetical protein
MLCNLRRFKIIRFIARLCITKLLLPKLECKLQMLPHPKQTRKRHFECYTKKHRLVKAQYFIL